MPILHTSSQSPINFKKNYAQRDKSKIRPPRGTAPPGLCCGRSVYLQRIPQGIDAFLLVRYTVDHLAVLLLILAALIGCKVSDG